MFKRPTVTPQDHISRPNYGPAVHSNLEKRFYAKELSKNYVFFFRTEKGTKG